MSEPKKPRPLAEQAHDFRIGERVGQFIGSCTLALSGLDAIGMIAAHHVSSLTGGAEAGGLFLTTIALTSSLSQGRSADVIDAEILRRQSIAESPNTIGDKATS